MVKELTRLDNLNFAITWTDEKRSVLKLSDLQKNCPCTACGASRPFVSEEVRASRVESVGSYALRVDFLTGCSLGIYPFSLLRKLSLEDI